MYRLSIKDSAIEHSDAVADLVADRGRTIELESRRKAEGFADSFSYDGPRVRVQAAAPQDPEDVDGYLIGFPRQFVSEPKDSETDSLTFDVGANQYGELGEGLVCGSHGLSPGVRYFLYDELDGVEKDRHRLRGTAAASLPDDISGDVSWSPDCLIQVRTREDFRIVDQYFCEVKTGDASFQRTQAEDIKRVAREYGVLKIRVIIKGLPDEYTIRISDIPSE